MRGAPSDQGSLPPMNSWAVPADQRATRLDVFVRRCLPHLSLRVVRKAIDGGAFWVNGRPGKKGHRLFNGDVVSIRGSPHLLLPGPLPERDLKVSILYEDESILVVDKPARMATHGFSGKETHTLANFLAAIRPSLGHVGKGRWEPGLVHRLDRDTSGIVLVAKGQDSYENLRSQFRHGLVKKRYWTLVWERTKKQGLIDYPLIHDPRDRRKMKAVVEKIDKGNRTRRWKAVTRFRTLGQAKGFSLLEVEMETGVTHQIRAHLEALGHPLVGDPLYSKERPHPFALDRQFLHAFYLGFHHPKSGREVAFESPLPQELKEILDTIGLNV